MPDLDWLDFAATSSGVSLLAKFDNRNNLFSPTQGQYFELEALFNLQALGSDNDFESYHAKALFWWPFASFVAGLRLDGKSTSGDTPFYEVPFIEMRGIPSMRYQGETVGVVETELTWNVTSRWAVLGFVGAGWAADSASDLSGESDTIISKGVGFRYLIAKSSVCGVVSTSPPDPRTRCSISRPAVPGNSCKIAAKKKAGPVDGIRPV